MKLHFTDTSFFKVFFYFYHLHFIEILGLFIVGMNPLIWIYSGRAYSELLAVGFMMIAYNLQNRPIIGGILGGFSV